MSKLRYFVVSLFVLCASVTPCYAVLVDGPYSDSVSFISDLEANKDIILPKFDTQGGTFTLTSVLVEFFHSGSADILADNDDPIKSSNANARIIRTWSVSGPDVSTFGNKTELSPVELLSADNGDGGTFDATSPDGIDFGSLSFTDISIGTFTPNISLYAEDGGGTVTFSVDVLTMVNDLQFAATDQYQLEVSNADLTVTAEVTYCYIPEPATIMLLGIGSLGLFTRKKLVR